MSAVAVIDSLEFARAGLKLRGSVPVNALKRLADVLFDAEGSFEYVIQGLLDTRRRANLRLSVSGTMHLQCQRCLGRLDHDVGIASTLVILPKEAMPEAAELDDPDAPDVLEADPALDVAALIEEEVMLSLPLAPRHPEGVCTSRFHREEGVAKNAFAQLAALKATNQPEL